MFVIKIFTVFATKANMQQLPAWKRFSNTRDPGFIKYVLQVSLASIA